MTGLQGFEVALRPVPRKQQRPGDPPPKRDTACRCFDVGEVGEVLDMPSGAVDGFIREGVLAVVEVGCRRLIQAGAVLAFVPGPRRAEVAAQLDDIERRRGGRNANR